MSTCIDCEFLNNWPIPDTDPECPSNEYWGDHADECRYYTDKRTITQAQGTG